MRKILFDKEKAVRSFWAEGNTLDGKDAICEAIKRAADDIMSRTLKVRAGQNWHIADRLAEQENSLASRIADYFAKAPGTKEDFDLWHQEVCNYILVELTQKYESVQYGKAQKILNMTFKNLYCTKLGAQEAYFEHCHMPLDSYTLEWTFRTVYPLHSPRPTKNKTPAWSNFSGEKTELDNLGKYTYWYVTGLIEDYFDQYRAHHHCGLTPLQAEFVIWKEIQLEMAAEGFYSQLLAHLDETGRKNEIREFRKLEPNKKITEVGKCLACYPFT